MDCKQQPCRVRLLNDLLTATSIFVVFFVNSLQEQMSFNLTTYVTSSFALQGLLPVASIMSSIIGGVMKIPVAKILDLWGREQGFAVMTAVCTLGLILMAVCTNVETYAAAQVRLDDYRQLEQCN